MITSALTLWRYTPPLVFLFALILLNLAHSTLVQYRGYTYFWLLYACYLCEWIVLFAEVRVFSSQKRRSRVLAYIILLVSSTLFMLEPPMSSILPSIISILPSYDILVVPLSILLAILFLLSFLPIFSICLLFDWDLPLAVRFTPFMFSLLDMYQRAGEALTA
jgi:hypothetical protein